MGREVAEQATERRGRVRRFMAWLGYGPEIEPDERPDRDRRRTRGKAEAAERRARRRAERLERREDRRADPEQAEPDEVQAASAPNQTPVASTAAEAPIAFTPARAPAAPDTGALEQRLAETEFRAHSAERRALEAQARVADAEASADRARATAEEARHGIGAISTKLARVDAERRLHEQAARRLESRCAELRRALDVEREEKTAIVEHFDRRLAAIEEIADAAAKRVTAAERELIKGSGRPRFDEGGRVERADRSPSGDPLEALESSIGRDKPQRRWTRTSTRPSVGQPSRAVKGRLTP
jgi:hypothetical protein